MTTRVFAGAMLLASLAGCSVSSVDSEFKMKLEMCERIQDEAIRVECIREVNTP